MAQKTTFKKVRLFKILRELNVSEETVLQHLEDEGFAEALTGKGLNASIKDEDAYNSLYEAFASDGAIASRVKEKRAARETDVDVADAGDGSVTDTEEIAVPTVDDGKESPTEAPAEAPAADDTPAEATEEVAPVEATTDARADVSEADADEVVSAETATEAALPVEDTSEETAELVQEPDEAPAAQQEETEAPAGEEEAEETAEIQEEPEEAEPAPAKSSERIESDSETAARKASGKRSKTDEGSVEVEQPPAEEPDTVEAEVAETESAPAEVVSETADEADEESQAAAVEASKESAPEEEPDPAPVAEEADEKEAAGAEEADAETDEDEDEDAEEDVDATGDELDGDEDDEDDENVVSAGRYKLSGTTVIGKIDLGAIEDTSPKKKRKRKRKKKKDADAESSDNAKDTEEASGKKSTDKKSKDRDASGRKEKETSQKKRKKKKGPSVDQAEVDQAYQETLRTLEQGSSRTRQRRRRRRRDEVAAQRQRDMEVAEEEARTLRVTEFIATGELANLMDVPVNEIISLLFESGMMVSINQRLDADTISFVGDEYNFEVEFITEFGTDDIEIEDDDPEDLEPRAPVVTVMGHVDHGKTSLLDYLRSANVVAGEAGGITQHIGAYHVELPDEKKITFLDTPGHEAFTAMRARGAQVTDIVILVVAADDSVMPQTIEAINHAKAANVPIVVAINKIDKPDANAQRVMQELADHGVLVEQYGGNVQCSLVSAKTGENIPELLEKVLLESDLLELKANPDRNANGVVIESRLDKGRGTVATILVQNGSLVVGDTFVAGIYSGRVRAMFDERDHRVDEIGPALPALVLGFDGAPEVGDQFIVMDEEREAREIAQKRQQIYREQSLRQRKHITLDEIGRRLALGDFQELNLIVKADVGGSVEALSDSLLKLSTEEVAVNIIHSGVGAITESDVMLASASDAVIIGFSVRPTSGARGVAEREEIDIRTYSIIYDAIEDVRDALEGLLSPEESERIVGEAEVRETFKVPKVGTVAGCYVTEGRIRRNDRIRLIREGIVVYDGGISSLKRFKDDAKEVVNGYECGIGMENYNDIKVGDIFEAYEIVETKRKLEV